MNLFEFSKELNLMAEKLIDNCEKEDINIVNKLECILN